MHKTLFVRSGSNYRIAKPAEILEAAAALDVVKVELDRPHIDTARSAEAFLIGQLRHCEEEHFCVMYLDARNHLIAFEKMFRGTIDGASVHPREVVRAVLDRGAASVIIAHNHPSGYVTPSYADETITVGLIAALQLIEVRLIDHVIVGANECYSFAEHGLL